MDKIIIAVNHDGTQYWYKNDKFHRDDGPAIIYSDGSQFWYKNNVSHRDNGPADIWEDGSEIWYKDGKRQWTK